MTFPTLSCFWQATIPLIRQNGHVEAVRFLRPQFAEGFGPRMRAPNQALQPSRAQASQFRARSAGAGGGTLGRLGGSNFVACLKEASDHVGSSRGISSAASPEPVWSPLGGRKTACRLWPRPALGLVQARSDTMARRPPVPAARGEDGDPRG